MANLMLGFPSHAVPLDVVGTTTSHEPMAPSRGRLVCGWRLTAEGYLACAWQQVGSVSIPPHLHAPAEAFRPAKAATSRSNGVGVPTSESDEPRRHAA